MDEDTEYKPDLNEMAAISSDSSGEESAQYSAQLPSRRTSKVWKYYNYVTSYVAVCRLCGANISHKTSSTNLKKHLLRKHDVSLQTVTGTIERDESMQSGVNQEELNDGQNQNEKYEDVWRFFKELPLYRARCLLCNQVKSSSSNHNLQEHLKRKHPSFFQKLTKLDKAVNSDSDGDDTDIEEASDKDEEVDKDDNGVNTCTCNVDGETEHRKDCLVNSETTCWEFITKVPHDDENSNLQLSNTNEVILEETYLDDDVLREDDEKQKKNHYIKPGKNKIRKKHIQLPNKTMMQQPKNIEIWHKNLEQFGQYVASLMKMLPRQTATRFQGQIVERLLKETIKYET